MHVKACHYKQCSAVAKILYVMLKVSFEIMQVNYSTIHFHCNITFFGFDMCTCSQLLVNAFCTYTGAALGYQNRLLYVPRHCARIDTFGV